MRFLLLIIPLMSAAQFAPPAFVQTPAVSIVRVGETLLSGDFTTTIHTNRDSIYYETNTAAGGVLPIYEVTPAPNSWINRATNVAEFDGRLIRTLENGTVNIIFKFGLADRNISHPAFFQVLSATAAGTNYARVTNVVGSLAHHVSTNIYSRITGTVSERRLLFTTRNAANTNYVRNPNFFLADVTGIEAYIAGNNSVAQAMNGVLVSPRHILSVAHIGSQMGQWVHFVNRTNNAVTVRQVIDAQRVGLNADMTVALLNESLPESIVPAAVITNWNEIAPQYGPGDSVAAFLRSIPVVVCNQTYSPGLGLLTFASASGSGSVFSVYGFTPSEWHYVPVGGDSGSPCLMPVNGRMAVVGNWTYSGAGGFAIGLRTDVQTAMDALCARNSFTNETLTALDTTNFTTY
jgi:hypothetical protein